MVRETTPRCGDRALIPHPIHQAERQAWQSDEARRASELKLVEAARREVGAREESKKAYENEQLRLDYIAELKRRSKTLNPKP